MPSKTQDSKQAILRTLRKALEEIDIGDPVKAQTLLESAINDLEAMQEAV